MKTLLLFLILLMPVSPQYENVNRVTNAMVGIEFVIDAESKYCTGFVVSASAGEVLTARHCVPNGSLLYVDGETSHEIRKSAKLALISIPSMHKPPLRIRKTPTTVGEKVWSFGYSAGEMTIIGTKTVTTVDKDFVVDGPLFSGMSGGPIVDEKGDVVGINQLTTSRIGIASGVLEIREFLNLGK